jgi:Holliday junction resolvase RusA-like endonuclease
MEWFGATGINRVTSLSKAQPNHKTFLCVVKNGPALELYIDGKLVIDSVSIEPTSLLRDEVYDTQVGKLSDKPDNFFKGSLDELTVAHVIRDSNWIKLCFMNQKQNEALVKFAIW